MDIRPIDLASNGEVRALHDVWRRALLQGREDAAILTEAEFVGMVRHDLKGELSYRLGAFVDGRLAGYAGLFLPLLDNLDKAMFDLCVDPDLQRRGIGSALLADVLRRCREAGRKEVVTDMTVPIGQVADHGYRRFAEAHGFDFANIEVIRYQQLPVAAERLDAWAASAAERHDGYTIETFTDAGVPEDLVPSLCVLLGQLAVDAPTGAVDWQEEAMSPERFADLREMQREQGRRVYETVALTPDREVVAQTTLNVPPAPGTDAFQWGTFVHREHRGHRLGLAVKTANLRAVQRAHPHLRRVETQNAETNGWMVSINELMGFEPVEACLEMVIRL